MWICAIGLTEDVLLLTKYFVVSPGWSLIMKGMTYRVFRVEMGVLGVIRVTQKSSTSLLVRYPCRVMGVESRILACLHFPDSLAFDGCDVSSVVGFERQMKWGCSVVSVW